MPEKRRQLTLFISEDQIFDIEKVRSHYNPEQAKIIASHVTLCREDEIAPLEKAIVNLTDKKLKTIVLNFENALRFHDGNGVLLPCHDSENSFGFLRKEILSGVIDNPRSSHAHITLMHPRNSTCTDEIFEEIKKFKFPRTIRFNEISLIEQEMGKEWVVLQRFPLK